jgi:membrane associated rhomboid family serine protease
MLYDRTYMKSKHFINEKSVCDILIIVLISSFILQSVIDLFFYPSSVSKLFCFGFDNLRSGFLWTILTYGMIHDGLFHLLANLIGLHFISRQVERSLGTTSFIFFCVSSLISGLVLWTLFNFSNDSFIVGCSSLVLGSLTYFCLTRPDRPITLLLFFVLPLSLKPKIILLSTLGIELYGLIFNELTNRGGIAHSAHLGGMCAGLLFFYFNHKKSKFFMPFKFTFTKTNRGPLTKRGYSSNYRVNFGTPSSLKDETDRILDKINDKGFGSLTAIEKETLEKAQKLFRN